MRRQITLLVPNPQSTCINAVRRRYNPIQAKLISAHLTLCRDDEVEDWLELQARVISLGLSRFDLRFDAPKRKTHWVYLPIHGSPEPYNQLRRLVLGDKNCRLQTPHITIIHPRNGTCTDHEFDDICMQLPGMTIEFPVITFIEKREGMPWNSALTVPLKNNNLEP